MHSQELADERSKASSWRVATLRDPWLWSVVFLVFVIHFARVFDQPLRGEESRWGLGGLEMLQSGEWIVPTQQFTPFPERPPLNSWSMAATAWLVGDMNRFAVRFPSVLATVLTSVLIYFYAKRWQPQAGAFVSALVFATFSQVMQLGHLGESEAVLTFFIAVSLLGWHASWCDGHRSRAWIIGFSFAALAALTKGLQGPVYFIVVSSAYVLWQGRKVAFSVLLSRSWWLGFASMIAIIGAWAVPFWLKTDLQSVKDVWTGLVADRVSWSGLFEHLLLFPVEILACLLPWSLFLVPLLSKTVRQSLGDYREPLTFACLALALTFPSVWLVTGARGRYYMPLDPVAAVALGIVIWTTMQAALNSVVHKAWLRFVRVMTVSGLGISTAVLIAPFFGKALLPESAPLGAITIAAVGLSLTGLLITYLLTVSKASRQVNEPMAKQSGVTGSSLFGFVSCVVLLGWIYDAWVVSQDLEHGDFLPAEVQQAQTSIDKPREIVSFGPVHHRFAFHWGSAIPMRDWPKDDELNPDFDYFAIDFQPLDNPKFRVSGRGRTWTSTSGTLPFRWEIVQAVPVDREYRESWNWVLVCRVVRDERGETIAERQPIPDFDSVTR